MNRLLGRSMGWLLAQSFSQRSPPIALACSINWSVVQFGLPVHQSLGQFAGRLIGRMVDWSSGPSVDGPVCRSNDLIGRLVLSYGQRSKTFPSGWGGRPLWAWFVRSVGQSVDQSIHQSIARSIRWSDAPAMSSLLARSIDPSWSVCRDGWGGVICDAPACQKTSRPRATMP